MSRSAAGYDPAVGLLSAAVLVSLLTMTMRRLSRSMRVFMPPRQQQQHDYGLLVAVASVPTRADADMLREVLAGHGIRATVAPGDPDEVGRTPMQVLVFPGDATRARDVLATR